MNESFPICYQTYGDPNHPCIILILGIGGQLIDWPATLTQGLVNKGLYVVTFDNRDCGLSRHYNELGVPDFSAAIAAKQQGKSFTPPYTLEEMSADVIALMDELHIKKAHIAGISMGGIIAQYVALNYVNRVLSLTCIATTSGDPKLPPAKKEVLEFFASSFTSSKKTLECLINEKLHLFKIYNHPDYFNEEKIKSKLILSFKRAHDPHGFKRLLLAMVCADNRTDRLKKMIVPCLIIHGDYDPVFPVEHGIQLAESITKSRLEIIQNMGHGLPDDICEKIVNLIKKSIIDLQVPPFHEISLSKREFEVLHYIIKGYTSKKIAQKIYLSPRTVEQHTGNIKYKFGVLKKHELIEKLTGYFI